MTPLSAAAATLRDLMGALPQMPPPHTSAWITAHQRREDALHEVSRQMRRQHGARIRIGLSDSSSIECCGVTARHPSLLMMFRRWLDRAEVA